ncbi:MAG: TadE/TadG family type IV pilus assembly protein [Pseudomonadota bacterium]
MRKFLRAWVKEQKATTAIEFSLLMIPYLFISLAIIELSIMYAGATLLEGATGSAARMIRTGQIQQSGVDPESAFRDELCRYATVIVVCDDIDIEIMPMDSFGDFAGPSFDADGNFVPQGVDTGGSNDRMLIRVAYRYSMMTPLIGPLLAGPDNSHLFLSTIVLQTEPYEFGGT